MFFLGKLIPVPRPPKNRAVELNVPLSLSGDEKGKKDTPGTKKISNFAVGLLKKRKNEETNVQS